MSYKRICLSSGHGIKVRGASGIIDEVDEAIKVMNQLATDLRKRHVEVMTFTDATSTSQNQNLWTITDWHNSKKRDVDLSIHFNAFEQRSQPVGTECWFVTQESLAKHLSAAMASVGLIDRGAKYSSGLHFLNQTVMPSALLEVCFVDSQGDCDVYLQPEKFKAICAALAAELAPSQQEEEEIEKLEFIAEGKCSWFGGPDDSGVSASEGLAWIYSVSDQPDIFLAQQPPNTTGLARRLNPDMPYVACRFYPKNDADAKAKMRPMLLKEMARVDANGKFLKCYCADWGPAGPESDHDTGRVADLSPSAMEYLGLSTDQTCRVTFPYTHRFYEV